MIVDLGGEQPFDMPDEMYAKVQMVAYERGKTPEEMLIVMLRDMLGIIEEDNPYT